MGIQVGDNFDHKSKKPLDGRTSYATLAAMKAVVDATIYEGCLAYCQETDKYYKFKSTNTIDADTGKWREYSGGSGGASDLADLGDVNLDEPTDGQVLGYDAETGKWVNTNGGSGGASTLSELTDVTITTPSDGDRLKFDATSEKWINEVQTPIVVRGYAQEQSITSPMQFIMAANALSSFSDIVVPDQSIFDGKTATAMLAVFAPTYAYFLMAEKPFNYNSRSIYQTDGLYYNGFRQSGDGSDFDGYKSFRILYANGLTSLAQTSFNSLWLEDVYPDTGGSIPDPNKKAEVYVTNNVVTSGDYESNTTVISKTLDFYEDIGHTIKITPELGKLYYDITTDKTYYWTGGRYVVNSTLNYNELKNKPQIPDAVQVAILPTAGSEYAGKIYQYTGATDTYINGYFYECVEESGIYSWQPKAVQAGGSGGTSSYNDLTDKPTLNSETISGGKTSADYGLQDQVQFDEMPTASADYLDKIVQFVGTTGTYTNGYYYKCVSDGEATPTYSWERVNVQPNGGSGGAELEETITTNLAVGAVPSGTVLAEGTSFTEVMKKLFVTELAPTTTFTASGSGIKEVGTSVTPTLTLTISDKGTGTPTAIKFYDGSTLLNTQNYVDGTNTYTYAMSAVTTTTTVKGVLEYKKSDNTTATVEKSATYTFVMASYYGAVTMAPTDKSGITALTKNVKNTKAQTATFTLSNQRSCYCYPASFGNLTSIKDANNFEYLSSYTKTTVTVDGVDYNVYTLTDPVTATGFKQVYA